MNDAFENQTIITGKVVRRIKGGLIVDLEVVQAFLPGSQVDVRPIMDFDVYLDKDIELRIVKFNESRKNIVVSSVMKEQEGIKVFNNLNDAIVFCERYNKENNIDEIILIGGAKIFAEGLKQTTKLVISWVDAGSIKGDVYFPKFNKQEWKEVNSKKFLKSETNQYDFEIKEYLRK